MSHLHAKESKQDQRVTYSTPQKISKSLLSLKVKQETKDTNDKRKKKKKRKLTEKRKENAVLPCQRKEIEENEKSKKERKKDKEEGRRGGRQGGIGRGKEGLDGRVDGSKDSNKCQERLFFFHG